MVVTVRMVRVTVVMTVRKIKCRDGDSQNGERDGCNGSEKGERDGGNDGDLARLGEFTVLNTVITVKCNCLVLHG